MMTPNDQIQPVPLSGLAAHRTDLVALVFGLMFLALGIGVHGTELRWFRADAPTVAGIAVIAVGVIGAVAVGLSAFAPNGYPE